MDEPAFTEGNNPASISGTRLSIGCAKDLGPRKMDRMTSLGSWFSQRKQKKKKANRESLFLCSGNRKKDFFRDYLPLRRETQEHPVPCHLLDRPKKRSSLGKLRVIPNQLTKKNAQRLGPAQDPRDLWARLADRRSSFFQANRDSRKRTRHKKKPPWKGLPKAPY